MSFNQAKLETVHMFSHLSFIIIMFITITLWKITVAWSNFFVNQCFMLFSVMAWVRSRRNQGQEMHPRQLL